MAYSNYLIVVVVISFSIIHFVEVSSFLARLAGVKSGDRALAYATQNAVFMLTRFFSMLLLPILGLIVDFQISKEKYLILFGCSLLGAFFFSCIALFCRGYLVAIFCSIINDVKNGRALLPALVKAPVKIFSVSPIYIPLASFKKCCFDRIFIFSAIIFSIYSTSIFLSFFFSLLIPEYRASISQLSGITNAFATVVLTFYIEPKISVSIDKNDFPEELIVRLLLGRIFGVGVVSQIVVLALGLIFL